MKLPSGFLPYLLLCCGLFLAGCSERFLMPEFDTFDSVDPIKTDKSYKKEAVRGLKILLARHANRAEMIDRSASAYEIMVILRSGSNPVGRVYLSKDRIGFQRCDLRGQDYSQPIFEHEIDSEDRRVIGVLIRY